MSERSYWLHASHDELFRHLQWLEDNREKLMAEGDARALDAAALSKRVTEMSTRNAALAGALERIAQSLGARADSAPAWVAGEAVARLRRCPDGEWVCPDCGGDREQCCCAWPLEGE